MKLENTLSPETIKRLEEILNSVEGLTDSPNTFQEGFELGIKLMLVINGGDVKSEKDKSQLREVSKIIDRVVRERKPK
jgi:hypothetical protein